MERVVCKVLLGQPESALEALSLSESTVASNQRSVSAQYCVHCTVWSDRKPMHMYKHITTPCLLQLHVLS